MLPPPDPFLPPRAAALVGNASLYERSSWQGFGHAGCHLK